MKRAILIFLLAAGQASAQVAAAVGTGLSSPALTRQPPFVVAGPPHNHPSPVLLYEDFENPTGYDLAGWGEDVGGGGALDEDYTNVVLYGTQSLLVNEAGDDQTFTTNSFTAQDRVWVSFLVRVTAFTDLEDGEQTMFKLLDESGNCQAQIRLSDAGGVRVYAACGGTAGALLSVIALNTTYTLWFSYDNNNGSDAAATVGLSEDGVRPTSGDFYASTTATATATQVSMVFLGHTAAENADQDVDFIVDHLLVTSSQIGNYP